MSKQKVNNTNSSLIYQSLNLNKPEYTYNMFEARFGYTPAACKIVFNIYRPTINGR